MLRITTNVSKTDGTRAIGTYIPAVNPDGEPNPVVATVLGGSTFTGRAYVVNAWYVTAYEPIRNQSGEIVGMLYVGVPQESVAHLREAVMDTKWAIPAMCSSSAARERNGAGTLSPITDNVTAR